MMEKGVRRWLVDISKWHPSQDDFLSALSTSLPQHHQSSITRFARMVDRKRALVSRLLQYALVHEVLEIPVDQITISRTLEGKPYLVHDKVDFMPNFNFNTSHHGDYVAIASEPLCLVGLDIVSYLVPENETTLSFIQNFSSYFSALEWRSIMNCSTFQEMLDQFYRYWCLKEAFVKAIGIGVGYQFDKVEFFHSRWSNIYAKTDGKEMKDWRFWLHDLGNGHLASIARGHPRYATETYKTTLKQIEFQPEEYHFSLHLPNMSFSQRTVEELLSVFQEEADSDTTSNIICK